MLTAPCTTPITLGSKKIRLKNHVINRKHVRHRKQTCTQIMLAKKFHYCNLLPLNDYLISLEKSIQLVENPYLRVRKTLENTIVNAIASKSLE